MLCSMEHSSTVVVNAALVANQAEPLSLHPSINTEHDRGGMKPCLTSSGAEPTAPFGRSAMFNQIDCLLQFGNMLRACRIASTECLKSASLIFAG